MMQDFLLSEKLSHFHLADGSTILGGSLRSLIASDLLNV